MNKIEQIKQEALRLIYEGDTTSWVLLNPKTERELFIDGSLKKNENIDDSLVIEWGERPIKLKTIITNKVEDFVIL